MRINVDIGDLKRGFNDLCDIHLIDGKYPVVTGILGKKNLEVFQEATLIGSGEDSTAIIVDILLGYPRVAAALSEEEWLIDYLTKYGGDADLWGAVAEKADLTKRGASNYQQARKDVATTMLGLISGSIGECPVHLKRILPKLTRNLEDPLFRKKVDYVGYQMTKSIVRGFFKNKDTLQAVFMEPYSVTAVTDGLVVGLHSQYIQSELDQPLDLGLGKTYQVPLALEIDSFEYSEEVAVRKFYIQELR